jgi:hypothetical protein
MDDQRPTAEEAAQSAADPDHLLPSERRDVRSCRPEDAVHWLGVYGELLRFKEDLLCRSRSQMRTMSEDARVEVQKDEVLMEHEAQRFRRRIEFWRSRLEDLRIAERDGRV